MLYIYQIKSFYLLFSKPFIKSKPLFIIDSKKYLLILDYKNDERKKLNF